MLSTQQIENTEVARADIDAAISLQDSHLWGVQMPLAPKTYLPSGTPRLGEKPGSFLDDESRIGIAREVERLRLLADQYADSPKFLACLGSLEAMINDDEQAEARLRRAAELSENGYFSEQLAEFYVRNDRVEEAGRIYQAQVDQGQPSVTACLRLAEFSVRDGNMDLAMQMVNGALEIDFLDWRAHLFAGTLYLMMQDDPDHARHAIRHFKIAREEQPRNPLVAFNAGVAYLMLKLDKKAINAFRSACVLDPGSKKLLAAYAELALKNSKHQEVALGYLEQYLNSLGPETTMLAFMVDLSRKAGSVKDYLPLIENIASVLHDGSSLNNAGVAQEAVSRNKAIAYYKSAIMRLEKEGERLSGMVALANLIDLMCDTGSRKEALRLVSEFMMKYELKDVVSDENAQRIIAAFIDLSFEFGRVQVAAKVAEEVLGYQEIYPHLIQDVCCNLSLWHSMGEGYDLARALTYAKMAYESAKKFEIDSTEQKNRLKTSVNNLSFIYAEIGRLQEADQLISSMDLSDLEVAWATKGLICLKLGNMEKGRSLYQKAIDMTVDPEFRTLIKNKMNLEICKHLIETGKRSNRINRTLKGISSSTLRNKYSWRSNRIEMEANELLENLS